MSTVRSSTVGTAGAPGGEAVDVPRGVACAQGPRAVEEALLAEVTAAARATLAPGRLSPLRVVVPSQSLREHLCTALVERSGGAVVGVRVQTLDVLSHEILERAGEPVPPRLLAPVAVREAARGEPALARELGELADGYAAVVASVDDLLEAGFTPGLAGVVAERLAEAEGVGAGARARAEAVLRVAARVGAEIEAGRLGHGSARLARTAALLADDPARLPARGLWIHGFADATGVQADLLEVLVRRGGARVWLDAPPAPATSAGDGPGAAWHTGFGARLRERLAGRPDLPAAGPAPAGRITATRHLHPDAEARAASAWARRRLDAGAVPERLAIVARDLARYRLPLRRHLGRLGVPFSGLDESGGSAGPVARRLGALEALLRLRGSAPAERWIDALARVRAPAEPGGGRTWREPAGIERADWLHALHRLGAATLDDVASLPGERVRRGVALDAPRGLARRDADAHPRAGRGRLAAADLARLVAAARACREALARLPDRAPLGAHGVAVRRLAVGALGWPVQEPEEDEPAPDAGRALARVLAELDPAEAGAAADRPVAFDDWMGLLAPRLAEAGRDRLGGLGAGVPVLSVMQARGRCFDGLWVLGLNRGVFPRRFSEDPILPDALRRPLRDVLPDLPLKGTASEEERFLFAQLLGAAPRVRLSCARHDEGGRQSPASPLLDRVAGLEVADAPDEDRSLHDHLLAAARAGPRAPFAQGLALALERGRDALGLGSVDVEALADARLAVLRELERRSGLGPYLGLVGAAREPLDPRRAPFYVTHLEGAARCPWKAFLEKILRAAPPPDALDTLPSPGEPRVFGSVVHAALERLADPDAAPDASHWPARPAPESLLRESAQAVLWQEGIALPGYASALARRAAPYVEVARRLALADPGEVVAVERDVEVTVADAAGRLRALRFKADSVERERKGAGRDGARLRLTDYKTGKPPSDARGEATRRARFGERLARGDLLQAHAYARAEEGAVGRYLFLAPDLDDAVRVLEARPEERGIFEASVAVILDALDRGALPPRLRAPDRDEEPWACSTCEVKLACLRGDSAARRRLGDWGESGSGGSDTERAALAVWRLAAAETG